MRKTRKSSWYGKTEKIINEALPETRGKVTWEDLHYMLSMGLSPLMAAAKYIAIHKTKDTNQHENS